MSCRDCACRVCVRSCELDLHLFTRGELPNGVEVCFTCDECACYTGDRSKGYQWRAECPGQIVARKYIEARAAEQRKKLRIVREERENGGSELV